MNALKSKALHGVAWGTADGVVRTVVVLASTIIMARILGPQAIGVFAVSAALMLFTQNLIGQFLPQSLARGNADREDVVPIIAANLLICGCIYGALYGLAPWLSRSFDAVHLQAVLRTHGLLLFPAAISTTHEQLLRGEMQFKAISIAALASVLASALIGPLLAWWGYGIWSLVVQDTVRVVLMATLLPILGQWKPVWQLDWGRLVRHATYGRFLAMSGVIGAAIREGRGLAIAVLFGTTSLGLFQRAQSLIRLPTVLIGNIVTRISLPVLSRMTDDPGRMKQTLTRVTRIMLFLVGCILTPAVATASPLFIWVLGTEWASAAPMFQILAVVGILFPVHSINLSIYQAFGRSDLHLRLSVVKGVMTAGAITVGALWGLYPLLWSLAANSVLSLGVNGYYNRQLIEVGVGTQALDVSPTLAIAGACSLGGAWLAANLEGTSLPMTILSVGFSTLLAFVVLHAAFARTSVYESMRMARDVLRNVTRP